MPNPTSNPQNLAAKEAQNQQMLQQMASREGQAATQLGTAARQTQGPTAASMQQLASQEAQNQQMLQQLAQREGRAASTLGQGAAGGMTGATTPSATGAPSATSGAASASGGAAGTGLSAAALGVEVPNLTQETQGSSN